MNNYVVFNLVGCEGQEQYLGDFNIQCVSIEVARHDEHCYPTIITARNKISEEGYEDPMKKQC